MTFPGQLLRLSFFLGPLPALTLADTQVHYVFTLMDSAFHAKVMFESQIQSQGFPDSSRVTAVAESISYWHDAQLNDYPLGNIWLAYERPADPGKILFLSNMVPIICLLSLRIDAMCTGCFRDYSFFGTKIMDVSAADSAAAFQVNGLENRFGLGKSLAFQEQAGVAQNLPRRDPAAKGSALYILKMENTFPSLESIRYIAYYTFVIPGTNSILPLRPSSDNTRFDSGYDANGKQLSIRGAADTWLGARVRFKLPAR